MDESYSYEAYSRSPKQNKLIRFFFMEISFPFSEDPVIGLHFERLYST
jgi:hypothetical protein